MAMISIREDPAVLAGTHRVEVIDLLGRNDVGKATSNPLDLQVRKVQEVVSVSRPLATVIAILAFSGGRQP
jgi:hypothetical protein